jgi:hypothetical protein
MDPQHWLHAKDSFCYTIFLTLDADLELLDLLVGLLALLLRHSGAHHQLYSLNNSRHNLLIGALLLRYSGTHHQLYSLKNSRHNLQRWSFFNALIFWEKVLSPRSSAWCIVKRRRKKSVSLVGI